MEDPQRLPNDHADPATGGDNDEDDAAELQRREIEAIERMLLAQEGEIEGEGDDEYDDAGEEDAGLNGDQANIDGIINIIDPQQDFVDGDGDGENGNDDMEFLDNDAMNNVMNNMMNNNNNDNDNIAFDEGIPRKNPFTYVRLSFWSAVALVYYAYRSRQQWYLALVFLSSSKYAYVIMGNAFVAFLIWLFRITTNFFLNGLRRNEAEGLADFFRWHITETCLALTIFRSELNVKTFVFFLFLVLAKCLHYVVDAREAHLRMTEEIVVANPSTGWIGLRLPHVKLFALIGCLQVLDIFAVILCGQDIMANGATVSILFAFESAIMLASVISNCLLWHLHLMDGLFHYLHERSQPGTLFHRWIYPWKEHKATIVFAVELQAQAAKFLFYLTFFAIVMTYYGLPINLIREVYVSFLALKQRVAAFNKYRQLMKGMNRFKSPSEEELEKEHICIICRDEMTAETAKRLPGCGHIFHKSCLREWLVQQQTCPICRKDISAMEARQKAQDQMNARIQEQQEQEQQEGSEEKEDGTGEEEAEEQPTAAQTGDGEEPLDASDRNVQRDSPKADDESNEQQPRSRLTTPSSDDERRTKTSSSTGVKFVSAHSERPASAFPAFYRVAQNTEVSVYCDGTVASSSDVVRTVPGGVVFVGLEMQYRKCNGANRMMIKIPDGWVNEDNVERIVAVPLELSSTG